MNRYLLALIALLLLKGAALIWVIFHAGIGLGPDEAQYWTWSQQLAVGYYSKPPGIAWEIWAGTSLFGNTELGVRAGALMIGFLLPLSVYALARACRLAERTSFWAALSMGLCPLGVLSSFLAITDGGMVLCWTLTCIAIAQALEEKRPLPFSIIGLLIALGALFKWPIYLLWIALLVIVPKKCLTLKYVGGILLSLLGLVPSLIWNYQQDWPTFRHVSATVWNPQSIEIGTTGLMQGNLADFLGAQALLLSPILFVLLIMALIALWRRKEEAPALRFCALLCGGLVSLFLVVSLFKKMQGNWVDFAYPSGLVVLAWYACEYRPKAQAWLVGGLILSVILITAVFSIPTVQSKSFFGKSSIPYRMSPFRHNVGWQRLEWELKDVGYQPNKHFLAADKYQTTSILSFYSPGQQRAYFLNLLGLRKNQYSYWPGLKQEIKKTGYFVVVENSPPQESAWKKVQERYQELLRQEFKMVHFLGTRPLFYSDGQPVKVSWIFEVSDYLGQGEIDSQLY
jgi:hypothetical protein